MREEEKESSFSMGPVKGQGGEKALVELHRNQQEEEQGREQEVLKS